MKKIFWSIALCDLALSPAFGQYPDPLALTDVSQTVRVTVMVNKKARLEVLKNLESIYVTPADSARGFLNIGKALRIRVWCNSPEGVSVSARSSQGISDPMGRPLSNRYLAIEAAREGKYLPLDEKGQEIFSSEKKESATLIDCGARLHLPPGSPVGCYRVDLQFTAVPK